MSDFMSLDVAPDAPVEPIVPEPDDVDGEVSLVPDDFSLPLGCGCFVPICGDDVLPPPLLPLPLPLCAKAVVATIAPATAIANTRAHLSMVILLFRDR
jgi:hypothetical protein